MQVECLQGPPFQDKKRAECYHALVTGLIPPKNEWREDVPWILYTVDILPETVRDHLLAMADVEIEFGNVCRSLKSANTQSRTPATKSVRGGCDLFEDLRFLPGRAVQEVMRFLPISTRMK